MAAGDPIPADVLKSLGMVTTAELLNELHSAAQVIGDHYGISPALVREILLTWEVHRPCHP